MTERKQPKGRKRLSVRQRAFMKNLAIGMAQSKAAVAAGYSSKHPRQSGHQALEQLRKSAPDLLAAHGLDDDALIDNHLLPLMKAEMTKFFPHKVKRGNGFVQVIEERRVEDNATRRHALDMALKIRGLYARKQENSAFAYSVIVINKAHRPDWAAMRKAHSSVAIPGLPAPPPPRDD